METTTGSNAESTDVVMESGGDVKSATSTNNSSSNKSTSSAASTDQMSVSVSTTANPTIASTEEYKSQSNSKPRIDIAIVIDLVSKPTWCAQPDVYYISTANWDPSN